MEEKYYMRDILSIDIYLLLKSENYAMKIFKLLSVLELQSI